MLIDVSYFTEGPRHIQNATLGTGRPNPNADQVRDGIDEYICAYQEGYLTKMLGAALGNKVNAYLVCQEEDGTKNAAFDAICAKLRESFADYVFYYIIRENNTQATITGLVKLKSANDYVSSMSRQVITWNRMVDRNALFAQWCQTSECPISGIYPDENMLTKINTLNI